MAIITPKNVTKSLKIFEKDDQTVIFLPMVHLAKAKFYDEVKIVIDSLKKEGFTVFYEQISVYKNQQKDTLDKNIRKLRKMFGANIVGPYNKKDNHSLPSLFKNKKYVSQQNIKLGLDSLDIIADLELTELIRLRELKEGKIVLTDCDFKTDLNEKYKCKTVGKYYATHILRDSIAANVVLKANKKKSLIVFGKAHFYGIFRYFRDEDFLLKE
ncbi:hypothetical protein [uncultured Polaribacter sp.]|uniref:hypothetical protein n=1 Tax=uncultured Polaribacter sp. TaxID=174711 RepID=UPI00260F04DB|nr:hypothetical protein [uncultured Polaribacter sp.]